MSRVALANGAAVAIVDPDDGGRLCSLDLGGGELLVQSAGRDAMWWGAFPMAPWTSMLRGPTIEHPDGPVALDLDPEDAAWHGVARHASFEIRARSAERLVLTAPLGAPWPFGGSLRQSFRLREDGLDLDLEVRAGDRGMPAAIGWHPWFVRALGARGRQASEAELHVPPGAELQVRHEGVPTGGWTAAEPERAAWNDGVRTAWPIGLDYPGVGRLLVTADSVDAILFTTDAAGLCVEPVTSPAERMDDLLLPGASLALRIRVDWLPAGVPTAPPSGLRPTR